MGDAPTCGSDGAVLIVEDDAVQLGVMQAMVRKLGLRSLAAATLHEAHAHLQNDNVHTVLLDLRLECGTSLDVLLALGGDSAPRSVILASGCDERTCRAVSRIAQLHGVHIAGTLGKPVREESLAELLRAKPGARVMPRRAPDQPFSADDVRLALAGGHIVPYYQPKVSLSTGGIVGVEALARWESAAHRSIGPERFVPVIESMGLGRAFTTLMLQASLAACARWRRRFPEVSVAVNVSPSLVDAEFCDLVRRCLEDYAVPPSSLVLEMTESSALGDAVVVGDLLTRLRIDGVELSIDDFGTGYSSMLSLLSIPFSEVKLDRVFVGNALHDADSARMLRALIAMSKEMGLRSVAEGIESAEVRDELAAYGCSSGQGWFWSAAMRESALHDWLEYAATNAAMNVTTNAAAERFEEPHGKEAT